ncbi:Delta(3,5)-Delta(2,4)-dienoyl-CoA isomerase, peroxisomal [Sesamum alatum]|uniref:Delta(3,5)-Delta(2,4)-dienoyl-CoA isomerase, peroxisomal n=1 Tax=Sesamum alatum TaxID=300844 RepID=A0AAE1YR58_9LAMI|nr:Delta(3,5)-Delta(2,4)-dienoyl-CoA isomerase, peroxisomal [Sesamum alatum]
MVGKLLRLFLHCSFYLFIDRPSRGNALSLDFFTEFPTALSLDQNLEAGVIILSGVVNHFCTGIDLQLLNSISQETRASNTGHTGEKLRRVIKFLQRATTAIEECRKPVIAVVDGACLGGGVDIITACDVRYSMENAFFSVKEVDLAITADLGSLQRLPGIVGFGNSMELALTARRFSGFGTGHEGFKHQGSIGERGCGNC